MQAKWLHFALGLFNKGWVACPFARGFHPIVQNQVSRGPGVGEGRISELESFRGFCA
jgi:hypothetical protein